MLQVKYRGNINRGVDYHTERHLCGQKSVYCQFGANRRYRTRPRTFLQMDYILTRWSGRSEYQPGDLLFTDRRWNGKLIL